MITTQQIITCVQKNAQTAMQLAEINRPENINLIIDTVLENPKHTEEDLVAICVHVYTKHKKQLPKPQIQHMYNYVKQWANRYPLNRILELTRNEFEKRAAITPKNVTSNMEQAVINYARKYQTDDRYNVEELVYYYMNNIEQSGDCKKGDQFDDEGRGIYARYYFMHQDNATIQAKRTLYPKMNILELFNKANAHRPYAPYDVTDDVAFATLIAAKIENATLSELNQILKHHYVTANRTSTKLTNEQQRILDVIKHRIHREETRILTKLFNEVDPHHVTYIQYANLLLNYIFKNKHEYVHDTMETTLTADEHEFLEATKPISLGVTKNTSEYIEHIMATCIEAMDGCTPHHDPSSDYTRMRHYMVNHIVKQQDDRHMFVPYYHTTNNTLNQVINDVWLTLDLNHPHIITAHPNEHTIKQTILAHVFEPQNMYPLIELNRKQKIHYITQYLSNIFHIDTPKHRLLQHTNFNHIVDRIMLYNKVQPHFTTCKMHLLADTPIDMPYTEQYAWLHDNLHIANQIDSAITY